MSDLISRSQLLKQIETWGGCVEALHDYIQIMPTAYDINKVVEELNKAKDEIANENYCRSINEKEKCDGRNCFKCCAEYLIEIVKRGGDANRNVVDIHLCDTCKKTYPECDGKNVKFGCDIDTYPNTRQNKDNIFYCDGYVKREKKKTNADRIVKQGGVSDDTDNVCEWKLEDEEANLYLTGCQQRQLIFEGTPKENGYRYCHYCGKKILCKE